VVLDACGAVGLWVLGPWVVYFMNGKDYMRPVSLLLPWYAWAVVPLSVANVLLNNLLARAQFKVVPALFVLAVGYAVGLTRFHDTPVMVIQTLAVANTLLLVVCAFFTWIEKKPEV